MPREPGCLGELGFKWREDAELVALGIGEDRPFDIVVLADRRGLCPQTNEAAHFRRLVGRTQVKVQPVLRRLVIGDLDEQKIGGHIDLRAALGWLDYGLMGVLVGDCQPNASAQKRASAKQLCESMTRH